MLVLVEEGFRSTTTRRVAERAGVSVGTLYQYFPNREALVAELLREQLGRLAAAIEHALDTTAVQALPSRLRAVIGALARTKADNAALYRALALELPRVEGQAAVEELRQQITQAAYRLLDEHADELDVPNVETACFVLVNAVDGAMAAAMVEGGERLADPEFVELLCRAALGMLMR